MVVTGPSTRSAILAGQQVGEHSDERTLVADVAVNGDRAYRFVAPVGAQFNRLPTFGRDGVNLLRGVQPDEDGD